MELNPMESWSGVEDLIKQGAEGKFGNGTTEFLREANVRQEYMKHEIFRRYGMKEPKFWWSDIGVHDSSSTVCHVTICSWELGAGVRRIGGGRTGSTWYSIVSRVWTNISVLAMISRAQDTAAVFQGWLVFLANQRVVKLRVAKIWSQISGGRVLTGAERVEESDWVVTIELWGCNLENRFRLNIVKGSIGKAGRKDWVTQKFGVSAPKDKDRRAFRKMPERV